MGLEVNPNAARLVNVQPNIFLNTLHRYLEAQKTPMPKALMSDSIVLNSDLYKYINANAISEMIKVNAEIKRILEEFKLPIKINMGILHDLVKNHLPKTKKVAIGITSKLPKEYKSEVNLPALQKASVLHDYGKILIPENILNKKGKLNENEREIMQKHSILGYEMLKTTDLDDETLRLIKNHHQNAQKTGYPKVEESFVADINLQILSTADIYSALIEKRSYKKAFSEKDALSVLHKEMKKGKIHPKVFKALVEYVKEEKSFKTDPNRQILNLKPINSLSA